MSISVRFLMDLRAMKDRGLNPTFEDVLVGLDRARTGDRSDTFGNKVEIIDGDRSIRCIEDVCRRRIHDEEQAWEEMRTGLFSGSGDMARDKTGAPIQCQNPNP